MNPGPPDTQVEDQVSRDVLIAAYTVVGARRTSLDTMMWQVPALATAAQAFLLTIALQTDGSRAAQAIAAALGAVLAVLSAQLMAKHRHLEMSDSRLTERIERQLGLERGLGVAPHAAGRLRLGERQPWWIRLSSYRLWLVGVATFGVADLVVAFDAMANLGLLG
ncbi:hypothetical protein OG994_23455 [Micromonospora globbae]|uniref:SLATT domain-containing protein n=1 Tax=Micromonospora globbae TaxID=1894969 RepID=A0ABZ1S2N8_9ACTN|nr:hypothetical protein [Micromonospora globbae]